MGHDQKPYMSVNDLAKAVDDGDYVIPYFQRGYEWNPSMISDLFESILQDYFAGMLLFWELRNEFVEGQKWDPLWGAAETGKPKYAILDGQQRISSLYYALKGPEINLPGRKSYFNFFINLKNYFAEDYDSSITYGYSTNYDSIIELKNEKNEFIADSILPLRLVADETFFGTKESYSWAKSYAKELVPDKNDVAEVEFYQGKIIDLIKKIRDYEFPVQILDKDRELFDICNIFARINQKGMRLSIFDLMNAFVYPHGIELKKYWEEVPDELKNVDSKMNEYQLKEISLFKQDYCSAKYVYNLVPTTKIKKKELAGKLQETVLIKDKNEFLSLWNSSIENTKHVFSRLKNVGPYDFGAISDEYIPNTTIIPVMGAILWEHQKNYKSKIPEENLLPVLKKWYWSAILSNDYSGSSDSVMSEDFRDFKKWFETQDINSLRRIKKIEKPYIQSLELDECSKGSSLYNGILSILALNGSPDFFTGRPLHSGTFVKGTIHDHHIFPQKVHDLPKESSTLFKRTKDTILNRTLLLDDTNFQIQNKHPSEYLKIMKNKIKDTTKVENILTQHFISTKGHAFMVDDNYDEFVREREIKIKNALIELIV
jgi:hypothetical protein